MQSTEESTLASGQTQESPGGTQFNNRRKLIFHIVLFLLTFISVTFASLIYFGATSEVTDENFMSYLHLGLPYTALILLFLSAHEFGHYFAAKKHGVVATLPYFLPMPLLLFGTLGAVIRIKSQIPNRKVLFDIGVAGPLAGFVVALAYLIIGMLTIHGVDSLLVFHPDYLQNTVNHNKGLFFGDFALYHLLREVITSPKQFFPPMNELYHYPLLCAGWFGMFVTVLNLLPVGQLDGGHIWYAMFGKVQHSIAKWFTRAVFFVGFGWVAGRLYEATQNYNSENIVQFLQKLFGPPLQWIHSIVPGWFQSWPAWMLWGVLLKFVFKFKHPATPDDSIELDGKRKVIGWFAIVLLILLFSYNGIYEIE